MIFFVDVNSFGSDGFKLSFIKKSSFDIWWDVWFLSIAYNKADVF